MAYDKLHTLDGIPINVVRSKRRCSISIQLDNDTFTLRIPHRASDKHIQQSLERFTPWIKRKQAALIDRVPTPHYEFRLGETFPWLGTQITLTKATARSKPRLIRDETRGRLLVYLPSSSTDPSAYLKKRVVQFYKNAGLQHLSTRADYFAEQLGKQPTEIKVYSYKRRWGSCSSKGVITFNWQILLAPAAVADYVVAHELAHLIQFDHSKSYWRLVERVMPDYQVQRKWLTENGHLLTLDNKR